MAVEVEVVTEIQDAAELQVAAKMQVATEFQVAVESQFNKRTYYVQSDLLIGDGSLSVIFFFKCRISMTD